MKKTLISFLLLLSVAIQAQEDLQITSFSIEKGSRGCYHNDLSIDVYKKNTDGSFYRIDTVFEVTRWNTRQSLGLNQTKDSALINSLLRELLQEDVSLVTYADLQINKDDIAAYQKRMREKALEMKAEEDEFYSQPKESNVLDIVLQRKLIELPPIFPTRLILAYESKEALAYSFLADSIVNISDRIVTNILSAPSVTDDIAVSWVKVSFVLADGRKISALSSNVKPNYLHNPWIIKRDWLKTEILIHRTNLKIGLLIDEISEHKLLHPDATNKEYAIHQLVEDIYNEKKYTGKLDNLEFPLQERDYTVFYVILIAVLFIFTIGFILFRSFKKW